MLRCAPILLAAARTSVDLAAYLRAGDERLVRPSPTSATAARQAEVSAELAAVLTAVRADDVAPETVAVLHLATTDNPSHRTLIGTAPGVIDTLVRLLAGPPEVAEEAAEAAWILAFNHPQNHAALLTAGAVKALAELFLRDVSERASMWAAAALQNLAASYCNGRCSWAKWGQDIEVVGRVTVDGEPARLSIAAHPRLLQAVEEKLCIEASAWPSQARVADRLKSGITAWAAAGLVKNLALSIPVQQELHGAIPCLCQLSHSPDWLENSKSAAALQHLGVDCQGYGKEEL